MPLSLPNALDSYLHACYFDDKPGTALLIRRNGETLFSKGRGLAKVSFTEPISEASNFRMASVSKQFTAMCIHLLEQEGKLTYEDNLLRFFEDFNPGIGAKITLRHLLTHSSGLIDYEPFVDEQAPTQVTDEEVLHLAANQTKTYFEPGAAFRYSNTGFVLLALVVEKVSGLDFSAFLRKYIFEPIGMRNSVLYQKHVAIPNRAMGYATDTAGASYFSDQNSCSATKGDGCLYTSLQDYQLWHEALQQPGPYYLPPLLKKVYFPVDEAKGWFYGMGWFFAKRADGTCEMYHTGNTCGFSHLVIRIPEQDGLVAYFSNITDNQHLLTDFLDTLSHFPDVNPESELVRQLGHLTR